MSVMDDVLYDDDPMELMSTDLVEAGGGVPFNADGSHVSDTLL